MVRVKSVPFQLVTSSRIVRWPPVKEKKEKLRLNPTKRKLQQRYRPGVIALRNIRKFYRHKSNFLIPKSSFGRLVKEIVGKSLEVKCTRFKALAMDALQEASENFLVNLFEDSHQCSLHTRRVTLFVQDMLLVHRIRAKNHINLW